MKRFRFVGSISVVFLLMLVLVNQQSWLVLSAPSARVDIETAWDKANDIGVYKYRTNIRQVTWPVPKLMNVGLSSQEDRLYIEGETNLPAETMQMKLWAGDGSVLNGQDSLEIKVAEGEALGRIGPSEWEEVDNVGDFFAPGGDPLAFLNAAADIQVLGTETRQLEFSLNGQSEISYTRYGFQVDGTAFAEHMRDLMQTQLREKGELPPGMNVNLAHYYLDMTGDGEIWLDSAGLPLRQIVHLNFPPQDDERIEAEIQTDFYSWGVGAVEAGNQPPPSPPQRGGGQIPLPLGGVRGGLESFNAFALTALTPWVVTLYLLMLFFWACIRYWRSPKLYNALALAVLVSMLFTPILQNQQVSAFYQRSNAEKAEYEQQKEQRQALREAKAELYTSDFDPNLSPLASVSPPSPRWGENSSASPSLGAEGGLTLANDINLSFNLNRPPAIPTDAVDSDGDGLPDDLERAIGSAVNDADTDDDGLSDGIEAEIGTEPTEVDTDGDSIPDNIEIQGIEAGGKTWYLNPLSADTNRDGRSDYLECPTGQNCPDTDGDGTPDAFDFDDDNDGVPDRIDTSAVTSLGTDNNQTYTFQVDNLTAGKTVFVDFQLRPSDPKHLWYAFNVLDWPNNDRAGQIQRVWDNSLGASGKDANGDMKLVPMLEIEIPFQYGHYGNLPVKAGAPAPNIATPLDSWLDRTEIEKYGMLVKKKDNNGNVVAYVPANVVRDVTGDSIVAFSARMPYWPTSNNFGKAHQARLVWTVQALIDSCQPPAGQDYDAYCNNQANWQQGTSLSIVHTYYDAWFLTGLGVHEDHGVKVAAIMETGQAPNTTTAYDQYLWQVADGLDNSFVAGRRDANGQRDLTVDEIKARFDSNSNAALAEDDARLWNIPKNALYVETFDFADQSDLATLPLEHTQQMLNNYFPTGAPNNGASETTVTILFAREERYRSANLDMGSGVLFSGGKQNGRVQSTQFTIKMDANLVQPQLMVGLKWAPYQHNKSSGAWLAYDIKDYWEHMDTAFKAVDIESGQQGEAIETGQMMMAKNYYLSLYQGVNGVVENGELEIQLAPPASDAQIKIDYSLAGKVKEGFSTLNSMGKIVNDVATKARNAVRTQEIINSFYTKNNLSFKQKLYIGLNGVAKGYKEEFKKNIIAPLKEGTVKGTMAAAGAVAGAALSLASTGLYVAGLAGAKGDVVDYIGKGVSLANQIKSTIEAVQKVLDAAKQVKTFADLAAKLSQSASAAAVVGLVISVAMQVGIFLFNALSGNMAFGSDAFYAALVQLIVMVVVAIALFALAQIPIVGPILVAIFGLIEGLIQLVCKIIGASGGICNGIIGNIGKVFVLAFAGTTTPVIDLQHKDRLKISNLQMNPDPNHGFAVGSSLKMSLDVRNILFPAYGFFKWRIDGTTRHRALDWDIARSNFRYELQAGIFEKYDIHQNLQKFPHIKEFPHTYYWNRWPGEYGLYYKDYTVNGLVPLDYAGVNQSIRPVWLAEGSAVHTRKCAAITGCKSGTQEKTIHIDLSQNAKYDIFPRTLAGFYNLTARQGGYALNWTDKTTANDEFASRMGKVLSLSGNVYCEQIKLFGINITCADGLPFPTLKDADGDGLRSEAGYGFDPDDSRADVDGDGLSDYYEVENGFNPSNRDSDSDGLTDYEEVRAGSNPLRADSDNDGLTDKQEVDGWLFEYAAGQYIRVTTNPLEVDTDGDGIPDRVEFIYKTNPNSVLSGGSFEIATFTADKYVLGPEQSFNYTANLQHSLKNTIVGGQFEVDFPLSNNVPGPVNFALAYNQVQTITNQITVAPITDNPGVDDSRVISLTATAGGVAAKFGASFNAPQAPANPVLHLALDEKLGATSFVNPVNNAANGTCTGESCPQAGMGGQLRTAVQFDGLDDKITFAEDNRLKALDQGFSISLWVKPQKRNLQQELLSTRPADALSPDGYKIYVYSTNLGIDFCGQEVYGGVSLLENVWNHVVVSFEANPRQPGGNAPIIGDMTVYLNGNTAFFPGAVYANSFADCVDGMAPLQLGAGYAWNPYQGLMDEVSIYTTTLSSNYVRDIYNYQSGYFEVVNSLEIGVDAEKPTAYLISTPFFYPQRDRVMAVGASDIPSNQNQKAISGIDLLEVSIDGGTTWQEVARTGGGYFTATPGNDPTYEIRVRATDKVGHVSDVSVNTLNIDDTPPTGALNPLLLQETLGLMTGEYLYLYGSLDDAAQSGLENALLEILGPDGVPVAPPQSIYQNASDRHQTQLQWGPIAIAFPPLSQGQYTPRFTVQDAVGNVGIITGTTPLRVDGLPPIADVTESPSGVIVGQQSLALHLPFEENATATAFSDASGQNSPVICNGSTCPTSAQTGQYGQGLAVLFDGVDDYLELPTAPEALVGDSSFTVAFWMKYQAQTARMWLMDIGNRHTNQALHWLINPDGSTQFGFWGSAESQNNVNLSAYQDEWVHVATIYDAQAKTIKTYLNGVESDSDTVTITPNIQVTGGLRLGQGGEANFKGWLDGVAMYSQALSPADLQSLLTASFIPADKVIHLPLDETNGATTFSDVSGNGYDGLCSGTTCPTVGQAGQFATALSFDGTDDFVELPATTAWNPGDEVTVGAWVNLSQLTANNAWQTIPLISQVAETEANQYTGFLLGLREGQLFGQVNRGFSNQATTVWGGTILPNTWTHIAMTFAAGEGLILYVNGAEVARSNGGLPIPFNDAPIRLGGLNLTNDFVSPADYPQGLIDEVLAYERALDPAEIAQLISNLTPPTPSYPANPVRHYPFDNQAPAGYFGQAKLFGAAESVFSTFLQEYSTNGISFAGWLNLSNVTSDQKVLGSGEPFGFGQYKGIGVANGQLYVEVAAANNSTKHQCGAITANEWLHFAIVVSPSGELNCYLNGQQTLTQANFGWSLVGNYVIGAAAWDTSALRLQGLMDDLLIYRRALSQNEVTALLGPASRPVANIPLGTPTLRGTLTDGPLSGNAAYTFHFEEFAGATAFNNSNPNLPQATCSGATCPTAGQAGLYGNALAFDGQDDYLTFYDEVGSPQMSVSAWVKRSGDTDARQSIVSYKESQNCGFVFALNEDGVNNYPRLWINLSGGWYFVEHAEAVPADTWVHLAATYDSEVIRLYRDGQEVARTELAGQMTQCAASASIGARDSKDQHYFPGLLDEVSLYDRPLSSFEVAGLANRNVVGGQNILLGFRHPQAERLQVSRLPLGYNLRLPLDETLGASIFADASKNEYTATCSICPTGGQTGGFEGAVRFANNQYLTLPNANLMGLTDQSFTAMAWVNLDDLTGDNTIFGTDVFGYLNGLHLTVRNGKPHFGFFSMDTPSPTSLNTGQWYHLAYRYDKEAQTQSIFINGQLDVSGANKLAFQGTAPLLLGKAWGGTGFKGLIDEALIYPRALTENEIAQAANPAFGVPEPMFYLPFEETKLAPVAVTNLIDASGNEAIVTCTTCPLLNVDGKFGSGIKANPTAQNTGQQDLTIQNINGLNLNGFSFSAWVKNAGVGNSTLLASHQAELSIAVWGDQLVLSSKGDGIRLTQVTLPPNEWAHVSVTWEAGVRAIAYINGQEAGQFDLSPWVNATPAANPTFFSQLRDNLELDELALYNGLLGQAEIAYLSNPNLWFPATISQPDTPFATWHIEVPAGLEGPYSLDLRVSDDSGLTRIIPAVWRGEIDTQAPQVTLIAENKGPNLEVTRLTATDYNLKPIEQTFAGLTLGAGQLQTSYLAEAWYTNLFETAPTQRVYQIQNRTEAGPYAPFVTARPANDTFTVCDIYEQCTTPVAVAPPPFIPSLPVNIPANPGLYLSFDEPDTAASTFADSSGNLALATCAGTSCPQSGQPGHTQRAVLFDGLNDSLSVPDVTFPNWQSNSGMTVGAWVKLDDAGNNQKIVEGNGSGGTGSYGGLSGSSFAQSWYILAVVNNQLYIEGAGLLNPIANQGASIPNNTWTHIAFTVMPQGDLVAYVNGQETIRTPVYAYTQPSQPNWNITIGRSWEYQIKGAVDEVSMYARALPAAEMAQLVNVTRAQIDLNEKPSNAAAESQSTQLRAPALRASATLSPSVSMLVPGAITSTQALSFSVYAQALSYLQALTVTVNGTPFYTETWPNGSLTETLTSTGLWTPTLTGNYTITAEVVDWNGATATSLGGQSTFDPLPPTLTLSTTQITAANFNEDDGLIALTGLVSDNLRLSHLEAQLNGGVWQSLPLSVLTDTWTASIFSNLDEAPTAATLTITVRAADSVGWQTSVTNLALVEATPPSAFTVTLNYGADPITQSTTIFDVVSPTLTLNWTPSDDPSGVVRYLAGWSTSPEPGQGEGLTVYSPSEFSHVETLADGQAYYAHVIAEDAYGNQNVQSIPGPIYVDYRQTPTYFAADILDDPYRGWQDNTCSLLGVDTRLERTAAGDEANTVAQKFYTTWDDTGLRMTWIGADWSSDGDLFIYLDTQAGGSIRAYNPYPATQGNTSLVLPVQAIAPTTRTAEPSRRSQSSLQNDQMAADYMIWVQEKVVVLTETIQITGSLIITPSTEVITTSQTYTASLLRWDENTATWLQVDGAWAYLFDGETTDIYLPFERLGVTDPATNALSLVAFASEDDALRLWATMPNRNPVNSQRVIAPDVEGQLQRFALTERYAWASLGRGVCANVVQDTAGQVRQNRQSGQVVQHTGADVSLKFGAEPVGIAYSVLNDDYFFIQEDLFSGLVDWPAELAALCAVNPDDPDCERDLGSSGNLDFEAAENLDTQQDVDHAPLGDGELIAYTLQLSNQGVGQASGVVVHVDTWGPVTLLEGEYLTNATQGEWYRQVFNVGTLAPGQVITLSFTGQIDVNFDSTNNEGFATLDMTVYDDTGDYYTNNLDWLYLDHAIDDLAPTYFEVQAPLSLIGPNENLISGFVQDYSAVPTITLRLTNTTTGQAATPTCLDDTPNDGLWACLWSANGATEGDIFQIDGRGTDEHGQTGRWSREYGSFINLIVDATAPQITLSSETQTAFSDQLIGPDESLLSGTISDNRLVSAVEVCAVSVGEEDCTPANLVPNEDIVLQKTYVYTDWPATPLPINASTACEGGTPLIRTFTITESFITADVDLGINLDHVYRHDVTVDLISPAGTAVRVIGNNSQADNYDILLNDAVTLILDDDKINHNTSAPFYDTEVSASGYLSTFNDEPAQGQWTLRLCDYFPEEDDGAYNHSQLILRAKTPPENTTANWRYTLPLSNEDKGEMYALNIYGVDSVGNRSSALALTYQVDTVSPRITVTTQTGRFSQQANTPVLAGTVTDLGQVATMHLSIITPDQRVLSETLAFSGDTWAVYTQSTPFALSGSYQVWVEAEDVAGNRHTEGPFAVQAGGYNAVYLPLIQK